MHKQMNENFEKTLVFLATYNEALNIEKICNLILRLPINLDLLVVDDNSPDGTAVILRQIQEVDTRLIIVIRSGKLGLGSAHKEAFTYASGLKYKYLVTLDADLSHNPEDIPKLLEAIQGKDFIIGTRWGEGGKCNYEGVRRILSKQANKLARIALASDLTEFTSSFRVFNSKSIDLLSARPPSDDGYAFFIETIYTLQTNDMKTGEVGIYFEDRIFGKSKIPKMQVLISGFVILKLYFRTRVKTLKEELALFVSKYGWGGSK